MTVHCSSHTALLETVVLYIVDDYGKKFKARALLDSGAMSNFISSRLAKVLFTYRAQVNIEIGGIGGSSQLVKSALIATVQSRIQPFTTRLEFLILTQPAALPTVPIEISSWNPSNYQLADETFFTPGKVDLIIGCEAFWEFHSGKKISLGEDLPWLTETPFGWTVSGSASYQSACVPRVCQLSTVDDRLENALQKFWEMENIYTEPAHSSDENYCEELYTTTTTRDTFGRFIVRLPRTDKPGIELGGSRLIAERRFLGLERRLQRDSAVKESYHRFMAEYMELGHMKKLEEPVDDQLPHCYLPHHPVFKASSTTTKTRVVFDASCKTTSGYSLNDTLLVGPVVQQDLLSIVMRFRTHTIAIVGDIEKMYRQVIVHPNDRPLQRILWRTSSDDPISTFELQTVTYGTASAPYLATKTLQRIAHDHSVSDAESAESIKDDFYMDDWLAGGSTAEEVIQKRKSVTEMLNAAGFVLRKFASNSQEVLAGIAPEDLAVAELHHLQDEQTVCTLGLVWDPVTDSLRFKVQLPLPALILTKRKVMSYIAQIFDPLGLVGPTITIAKLFMQRLWALKIGDTICEWDTPLPAAIQDEWKRFHNTLFLLSEVRIPRFVSLSDAISIELHFFADASEDAYGSCCYVRAESQNGVAVQLLASKAKVTPLSTRHSIARLELCAAQISSQLYKKVKTALKISAPAFFWSDSTTVLQWLRSSPSRWKTFVANRVSQIQLSTDIDSWKHVAGSDNPADDISRGLKPNDILHCERWWKGPSWLSLSPDLWPKSNLPSIESTAVSEEGRRIPLVALTVIEVNFCNYLFSLFEHYSKLRRITAFCLRYINCLRKNVLIRQSNPRKYNRRLLKHDSIPPLTTAELQFAEMKLCLLAQSQDFAAEIVDLGGAERVSQSSRLKWLSPFLDKDGILRVGGRLKNAALPYQVKHPIVLSAKHPLSTLLASQFHLKLLHAGPQLLLASLRQKFWILGGRNLVKSVYHLCHVCFKNKPTLVQQSTADLPSSRVSPTRPFLISGIDYCGPFYIKSEVRTRGPRKVYVAIFICFSTRAVHIELVSDLSTPAFISALRRFIGKRGRVAELHSDNATAFKGAQNTLNRIYQRLKVDAKERDMLFNWCSENQIRWKFIPPRSPHFGGLWEAAVKSTKTHMLKTMGSVPLAYEDMLTLLAQIEMCLNSRPLVPLPEDPNDLDVLTPGHFLIGENFQSHPEDDLQETPDNLLNHWELTQKKFQTIWSRWYPEYLQQLQSRAIKGCKPPVPIELGRIVIIKEENMAPANWPLGKIVKLHPGKDGIVRVVTIRTANNEVTRCVNKIALLPLAPTPESTN